MAEHFETSDITPRLVAAIGAAALLMLVGCALIIVWLEPEALKIRPLELPAVPGPTLQLSPRADMERFRAEEMAELQSYGWVDREKSVVRIPIDRAMVKVVHDGIPGWPAEAK